MNRVTTIVFTLGLLVVAGAAIESVGVTDSMAYALLGYGAGFLGWAR